MPLIEKCHFEEEFKKELEYIETRFDSEFESGIFYDLEGISNEGLIDTIKFYPRHITALIWDLFYDKINTPELETIIKDYIVTLLYLLKKVKEENKSLANES